MFAVLLILALSALNEEVIAYPAIEDGSFILDYPVEVADGYSTKAKRNECSECWKLDEPSKQAPEKSKRQDLMDVNPCPEACYLDNTITESNEKKTKKNNRNKLRTRVSIATQVPMACMRLFNMNTK